MTAPWFSVATYFKGLAEVHGATDNPKIVEMFNVSGHPEVQDDETAWCAAFVGACLRLSGFKSSGGLNARSYQNFGRDLGGRPEKGCIVVLWRGSRTAATGHVGFFVSEDTENIFILGGNQNNAVNVQPFDKDRLLAYRMPTERAPIPDTFLPNILVIDPANAPADLTGVAEGAEELGVIPSPDIRALQIRLSELGFDPGPIDGEFGPLTSSAISAFQSARGLVVTGVADLATQQAIGLAAVTVPQGGLVGVGTGDLTAEGILRMVIGMVVGAAAQTGQKPTADGAAAGGTADVSQLLQTIFATLLGRQVPTGVSGVAAAPTQPLSLASVLSPIDKLLGGEALAGKKTLLAVIAYVVLAILQAKNMIGPATGPSATPTGEIITTLIAAFGGLGLTAKIDRVVRILGLIAAK